MIAKQRAALCVAVLILTAWCRGLAGEPMAAADPDWVNPWRNFDGSLSYGSVQAESEPLTIVLTMQPRAGQPETDYAEVNLSRASAPEEIPQAVAEAMPGRAERVFERMGGKAETAANGSAGPGDGITAYQVPGRMAVQVLPRDEFNRFGGGADNAMLDRGIDSADTKWRRQARLQGVRMRMLNGPEAAYAWDGYSTDYERGGRNYLGAVVPLNPRWELAALNKFANYKLKETGDTAGIDALTLRVGANPSVSFRPWVAVTPYVGFGDRDGGGVGFAGGIEKNWRSGISLRGEAYAWQPWDEGYDTAAQDGRSHGLRLEGTLPVDRRLTITGGAEYEWLELGPNAPGGSQYAGRRGSWTLRADYRLLKRDDAYMGYGFREQTLWNEQLVPVELGVFADIYGERYIRPKGFTVLNPTEKSLRERVGLFYYQAVSPHIGFNTEAFIGQDTRRRIAFGELYGITVRLNVVINPNWKIWGGWGYETYNDTLAGGGGPEQYLSFGMNYNF